MRPSPETILEYSEKGRSFLHNASLKEPHKVLENLASCFTLKVSQARKKSHDPAKKIGIFFYDEFRRMYVKDKNHPQKDFWAPIESFPLEPSGKRIVLLGESVARGYFYEPDCSPASMLQSMFNRYHKVDVVDLACTSIQLKELRELFDSCFQLNPNYIIIFAGNNWIKSIQQTFQNADLVLISQYFDQGKFGEIKNIYEKKVESAVGDFFNHIIHAANEKGVKIQFIIPEFNLKDYLSAPAEKRARWIPLQMIQEWHAVVQEAQRALAKKDYPALERLGEQLVSLSIFHPLGYEYVALSKLHRGLTIEARHFFEQAKDTGVYRTMRVPRCLSSIKRKILEIGAMTNVSIVNLPQQFQSHYGKLPDREIFLDYCHLTYEGLLTAMSLSAQLALKEWFDCEANISDLRSTVEYCGNSTRAKAHVLAAIHNTHFGPQSDELMLHHFREALILSPSIGELLLLLLDLGTTKVNSTFTESFGKLRELHASPQFENGFLSRRSIVNFLEYDLIRGFCAALKEVGIEANAVVSSKRLKQFGLRNFGQCNLLERCYWLRSYLDVSDFKNVAYLCANDVESSFFLVCLPQDVNVTLTQRTQLVQSGVISFSVNGHFITTIDIAREWTSTSLKIDKRYLNDLVNIIKIDWPLPTKDYVHVQKTSSKNVLANTQPVFGEIFDFTASYSTNH